MTALVVPFPPNIEHLVDALYPPARQMLALEVATIGRRMFWIGSALQLIILAVIYWSGASTALRATLERRLRSRSWISATVVAVILVALAVIMLPLTWFDSYVVPHWYDLSRETPALWFHDWAIAIALGTAIAALGGAFFFGVVRRFPRAWPFVAGAAALPVVIVASIILPVVIEPLFNTYTPLPPSPLTKSILEIAAQHGVTASAVYEFDLSKQSTAANAFVSGIGGTERIALADTLLSTFKPDETIYVTAHELGHYVHGDLWRGALYSWLGSLAAIAFLWAVTRRLRRPLEDPALAPLILLLILVFSLATQPIESAVSRQIEHNADVFAAENTHLGTAGVRAFARLGSEALSTLHPPPLVVWYFYDHPPLDERIMYAAEKAGIEHNPALQPPR